MPRTSTTTTGGSGGLHAAVPWSDGASLDVRVYQAKRAEETTTGVQIAFVVPDIDEAHLNAVAAGATVIHDPLVQPGARRRAISTSTAT